MMRTNAPKFVTWIISVILGGLGIISHFVAIPIITPYGFWLLVIGFVLLALSSVLKGM